MSDKMQDSNTQPLDVVPRPAAQPVNLRPLAYPEVELLRYDSSADLTLRGLLKIIRKRKWMILGIAFIVTTLVTIETFRIKPLYQATATIEIDPNGDNGLRVGKSEVFIQQEEDLEVTKNTSQLILRSAPLLEDVAAQLRLDQTPAFLEVTKKKSFLESINDIAGKIQSDVRPKPPEVFSATPVSTKVAGNRASEEVDKLAPFVSILESGLAVKSIPDTRAMTIAYKHTDPALATRVANAIAARFVETSFDKKIEGFTSASEWLDQSTRELKTKVELAQQKLADYTKQNNIYAVDGKATLITENLARIYDQAMRAETNRLLKESIHEQVVQGRSNQIPEAFADPKTAELEKRVADLEVQAAELKVTFGPKYSKLAEVNEQIDVMREQISTSRILLAGKLRADYDRAVIDEQKLKASLDLAKADATRENQGAIEFSLLKQDVDTSNAIYTEFLQNTSQADLQIAQQRSNIRIIAPARVPKSRVSPDRRRNIIMGLLVSLFGGIVLASILERLDDSIRNTDDVHRYTQLPTLAVIPAMRAGNSRLVGGKRKELPAEGLLLATKEKPSADMRRARVMELDGKSPVAKAYRALRTGLLLSAPGRPPKTILVTSVRMGDGKTTTATNVAISLAQLGSSVVLVDCDLRKPSVHGVFGVPQSPGLSTYLTSSGSIDEIMRALPVENLRLIPAGPTPPNPSELLSSDGMKRLVEQLSARYDHVVLDSPPIASVTDPVVLSTFSDGVILVVNGGRNSRQAVQRGRQEISAVGSRIFGVVLNNVDLKREGYDDYHYYTYSYPNNGKQSSKT